MSNSYYNHATYPTPNSPGSSAQLRAELESITAGFALLPTLAANGYKVAMINSAGTAMTASSALQALAITASTLNSTPIGASAAAAGTFTSLTVTGTASLGSTTVITGGTINSTPIGGTTPSTGAFTTVSASSGFTGALAGNVTGNLAGNVTGNVAGNLTGNVASSGTSTFAAITMSGAIAMGTSKITGMGDPTLAQDAATKTYVDTADALKLNLSGGTMSGAIAMGTSKITGVGDPTAAQDAATKNYTDTGLALKLNLVGGTMSGAIAMGTSKITDLGNPTLAQDATTKTYVDTADALKLNLSGGTMSGAIAMGTSKITGVGDPTAGQDVTTKTYVDIADSLKLNLSGGTMSGSIAMGTSKITGLGDPTAAQDAATKNYVDNMAQGLDAKASCVVATTTNITLSGTQTIDGVLVVAGDRVLVKDQSTQANNGIYLCAAGSWTRSIDTDTWAELVSAFTFIEKGTTNGESGWVCTVDQGGTIGTTAVTWVQFSGAGQITAGAGLTKTGNTLDVGTASSSRIVVNADNIDLATTAVSAGTYQSLTVDTYGRVTAGTNPTTIAGYNISNAYTISQIDASLALKLNLAGGTMSGAIAMGTSKITGLGDPTLAQDAATKTYVDSANALKLNLAGGTMSGAIAMGTSKITGLGDPTLAQDATTKTYVDTANALKLNLAGGTMSGALAMGTSKITGLGNPTTAQDAATKTYVDTADALKLNLTGGTMSGVIAMGASKITGLADPTAAQDATTKTYVDGILGSATAASTSASAAAVSATNASNSATASATSATASSTSAASSLSYLNSFRGQYYGSLSSDPTIDPLGSAMTSGDLYFNTTIGYMKVYDGAAWLIAYLPASGYLALGGGTMTGAIAFAGGQTWPTFNQNTSGTSLNVTGVVAATNGGTGQSSYAVGDLVFASTTTALSKLADVATGNALISGGVGIAPAYGKIGLTTHISGTLPIANGGTNATDIATARTNLGATTVGGNFYTLANPTAITFPRINADNTVSALDAPTFRAAIGAGTSSTTGTVTSVAMTVPTGLTVAGTPITASGTLAVTLTAGYSIPTTTSQTNWDTAYTDRLKWDGGSTGLTAATGRISLGGTTVGQNFFTLVNPSAITFPRMNADNTVSALDAPTFRAAIGAGTSSTTGTVTSVAGTGTISGLTLTGTVTTTGNLTLGGTLAVTASNFSSQTANTFLAGPNGIAGTPTFRTLVAADVPTLNQNTTGTAANVTGTVAIANGGTGAITAGAALTALGAYAATNPSGYTSNTGTVTSVSGAGSVSGLTLTGTVSTSGSLTLGGTLSVTNANTTATALNTASAIVARDASGNFNAGTITATLSGNATSATTATSATSASTATNLAGGSAGTIPYQSAAGTTVQLAAGTSGFYLKSNGASAPSWAAVAGGSQVFAAFGSTGGY